MTIKSFPQQGQGTTSALLTKNSGLTFLISESAMTSGLEWNIKLSQYDSGDILEKIRAAFEGYWNNPEFTPFIAAIDSERLRQALKSERRTSQDESGNVVFNFDITPYYYQQEILDKLKAEREVHHSFKNLVVAATGTGKTVIAAFDYRDFGRANPGKPNKLLFVAHRKEILSQSLACFRGILKDLNFGSMMVGGFKPDSFDHLFVSIQSFNSKELTEITPPDFYDYIVIDEFHHAAAPSYQALLDYYKPKILLGLTATPERADGRSIYSYFEGRVAAEIRLWEAIERKLLSPFHYFGVTDNVDLSQVRWVAGRYDEREIENLYVFERAVAVKRVGNVIKAIERYSPSTMYQDYSINEELFHWQSQSRTTEESVTGQRYINQLTSGGKVLFFVREYKDEAKFTSPYTCLGLADFQSHYGSAPISIVWKMKEPLLGFVMKKTVKV